MFAKMVIGECLSEAEVREFSKIYETDVTAQLVEEPGYAGSQLLIEEGGNMVISLTCGKRGRIACATTHRGITVGSSRELNAFSPAVSLLRFSGRVMTEQYT